MSETPKNIVHKVKTANLLAKTFEGTPFTREIKESALKRVTSGLGASEKPSREAVARTIEHLETETPTKSYPKPTREHIQRIIDYLKGKNKSEPTKKEILAKGVETFKNTSLDELKRRAQEKRAMSVNKPAPKQ